MPLINRVRDMVLKKNNNNGTTVVKSIENKNKRPGACIQRSINESIKHGFACSAHLSEVIGGVLQPGVDQQLHGRLSHLKILTTTTTTTKEIRQGQMGVKVRVRGRPTDRRG